MELRDWYIFLSNVFGAILGLWYVMQCLPLLPPSQRARIELATLLSISVWIVVGELRVLLDVESKTAQGIFAWMTVTGLLMFYVSPLASLTQVIKEHDSSSILPHLAAISLVNGSCWALYGVFAAHNNFIAVPNAIGVLLALVQLGLRAVFPAKNGLAKPARHDDNNHIAFVEMPGGDGVFQLEDGEAGRNMLSTSGSFGVLAEVDAFGREEQPMDAALSAVSANAANDLRIHLQIGTPSASSSESELPISDPFKHSRPSRSAIDPVSSSTNLLETVEHSGVSFKGD
jgi:uncharacterized protein with PQ loop repeat